MKTGDLLLFNGCGNWLSSLIKMGTHSNYTHIAMVLKDPTFLHPHLKGTYVWESGWEGLPDPQDGKVKLGAQITPLSEILESYSGHGTVLHRAVQCDRSHFSEENLKKVHDVVYEKPYDIVPLDWVEALVRWDSRAKKVDRFWCSALVGYIYTQCGVLNNETDWSILRPCDFSTNAERLNFTKECSLSPCERKL